MKIEKLTENKIRIIVKTDEFSNCDIDLNNITSQKFFLDILDKAEKEVGFYTKDCRLLIEFFSSLDDVFVFTITKYYSSKKKKYSYKFKEKSKNLPLKSPIYSFSSFEEFCNLCEAINVTNLGVSGIAKKVSLYLYNDTYYLIFYNLNLTYNNFKKLFSVLSEFSNIVKNSDRFASKLLEYGKPIIKQNALKTGIRYFV